MKFKNILLLLILLLVISVSCADTVQLEILTEDSPYGFWGGLWHGICVPISFIGSLIWDDISMYAINNNGDWYDCGFWLGVGGLGGLIGRSSD